jgi:hypothetical protein
LFEKFFFFFSNGYFFLSHYYKLNIIFQNIKYIIE